MLARVVVVALVALLEQTEQRTAANQTTVAATLSVRLTAGTDTYRVGEHIPIELEFREAAQRHPHVGCTLVRGSKHLERLSIE